MLRRIGFRRLLPLIQLPLYVVLVLYSYPMYVRIAGIPVLFRSRHVAYQELEGVPFNPNTSNVLCRCRSRSRLS